MTAYTLIIDNRVPIEKQFKAIPADAEILQIKDDYSVLRYRWMSAKYAKLLPVCLTTLELQGQSLGEEYPEFRNHFGENTIIEQFLEFLSATPTSLDTLNLIDNELNRLPLSEFKKLCAGIPKKIIHLSFLDNVWNTMLYSNIVADLGAAFATLTSIHSLNLTNCFNPPVYFPHFFHMLPKTLCFIKVNASMRPLLLNSEVVTDPRVAADDDAPWLSINPQTQRLIQEQKSSSDIESTDDEADTMVERVEKEVLNQLITLMIYAHNEALNPQHYNRFMHWLHHGRESEMQISRAITTLQNTTRLDEAILLLEKLFSRHSGGNLDSTSGLHTNSFDTIFLQLLFADGSTPYLPVKGLMFLTIEELYNFKSYSLEALNKGEFRMGRDPENLSGPGRLPEKERAEFRRMALTRLAGMLPALGYDVNARNDTPSPVLS